MRTLSQTSATIIAVIISSGVSLLISILTIISQGRKQSSELEKQIAVMDTKMDSMKEDIKNHNKYAQMFSESVPAIKQHMEDTDRRLDSIERRLSA